jgi:hypothetical protein
MKTYLEKNLHRKRVGEGPQGVGPEFKPQYGKKKKKKKKSSTSKQAIVMHSGKCYMGKGRVPRKPPNTDLWISGGLPKQCSLS